ncbi:hypothetical protein [Dysgonomonas reticulitermitis]
MKDIIDFTVAFIATILGIAFPLILQSIQRLDEKYSSTRIMKRFVKETYFKLFYISLIITIVLSFLWFLDSHKFFNTPILELQIDILLYISTGITVVLLFLLFQLIQTYNFPTDLSSVIFTENPPTPPSKDDLLDINDLYVYGMHIQDEDIALKFHDCMISYLAEFREQHPNEKLVYEPWFYKMLRNINESMLNENNSYVSSIYNVNVIDWLLDRGLNTFTSNDTFRVIWLILLAQIKRGDDNRLNSFLDSLYYHMQGCSFQHNRYDLSPEKEKSVKEEEENLKWFFYTLSGLLLNENKIYTIELGANLTHSEPPKYYLTPNNIDEVMRYLVKMHYQYELNFIMQYFSLFQYPNLRGIFDNDTKVAYIKEVFAFFFLRLYTLIPNYGNNPLREPNYPNNVRDLHIWLDEIKILKSNVEELLHNKRRLEEYRLPMANEDWEPIKEGIPLPLNLIDILQKECENRIETLKNNPEISKEKIDLFKEKTRQSIDNFRKQIKNINNYKISDGIECKIISHKINGNWIVETAAFCDNQEISYVDFDEISGNLIMQKARAFLYKDYFSSINTTSFKVSDQDIFSIINKLLGDSLDLYVIINFDLYVPYYAHFEKDIKFVENDDISKAYYRNVEIITPPISVPVDERGFCVMKKEELANITLSDPYDMFVEPLAENKKKSKIKAYVNLEIKSPKISECIKLVSSYNDKEWDNIDQIEWSNRN